MNNEEGFLRILSMFHEKMQQTQHQEIKDMILCQLVCSLLQFVPSERVREKIKEILIEYNSQERTTRS